MVVLFWCETSTCCWQPDSCVTEVLWIVTLFPDVRLNYFFLCLQTFYHLPHLNTRHIHFSHVSMMRFHVEHQIRSKLMSQMILAALVDYLCQTKRCVFYLRRRSIKSIWKARQISVASNFSHWNHFSFLNILVGGSFVCCYPFGWASRYLIRIFFPRYIAFWATIIQC